MAGSSSTPTLEDLAKLCAINSTSINALSENLKNFQIEVTSSIVDLKKEFRSFIGDSEQSELEDDKKKNPRREEERRYARDHRHDRRSHHHHRHHEDSSSSSSSSEEEIPDLRHEEGHRRENYRMKVEIPEFKGNLDIEPFLDWVYEVEKFFELMEIPADEKVRYVAYKLKGGACTWWTNLQKVRGRMGKSSIKSWPAMKKAMQRRFLPEDYMDVLYEQYSKCEQGTRSVAAYTDEFLRLSTRVEIEESESGRVLRYKGGLRPAIQKELGLQSIKSVDKASSLALQAERQLERLRSRRPYGEQNFSSSRDRFQSSYPRNNTGDRGDKGKEVMTKPSGGAAPTTRPQRQEVVQASRPPRQEKVTKEADPYKQPFNGRCYKCREWGHSSSDCRKQRAALVCRDGEEDEGEDIGDYHDDWKAQLLDGVVHSSSDEEVDDE